MTVAALESGLIAAAALVALVVATRSPFHAFCVLLVALPFENALVFTSVFTVTPGHLALLTLAAVTFYHAYVRRVPIVGAVGSPLHGFVVAYLGISLLSIAMTIVTPPPVSPLASAAGWRATELRSVIQVCFLLFMSAGYFATVFFCSEPEALKRALRLYLATAALIALYGLYQIVATIYYLPVVANLVQTYYFIVTSFRPNATFREPLNFGHYLVSALPLTIALFLHRDRLCGPDRVTYGIGLIPAICVLATALLATIARGAWIGFIGAAVVIALLSGRRALRAMPIAVAVGVAALFALARTLGSWRLMFTLIANRFDVLNPINIAGEQRLVFIPFIFGLWQRHPVFGVGYGNYALYQIEWFESGIAGAYGLYWQALVETGVLGLGVLLMLIGAYYVIMLRAIRRAAGSEWQPWLIGETAALTGLMIQYFTAGDRLNLYVWVIMGLSMATVNVVNAQHDARNAGA